MTIDEHNKIGKSILSKKKKKSRKPSDDLVLKKFESLMNAGENMEIDMRRMDSKLRKINKVSKGVVIKSILKTKNLARKPKPKTNVAFDLKNIEYM
mmetsp:Transcript_28993/g.33113  ORF Transcript_28993/g.33113 Transcript_28993/m.33113 type:complete len:96 (-) Transcript_28993:162-449(-)